MDFVYGSVKKYSLDKVSFAITIINKQLFVKRQTMWNGGSSRKQRKWLDDYLEEALLLVLLCG